MKIKYKGVDITNSVIAQRCWHEMYAADHADNLMITFDDKEALWDRWAPSIGDEIEVTHGSITTGIMFVKRITPQRTACTIMASSMPIASENKKSKAWKSIRLPQIGKEVAEKHGLKFKGIDIPDILYPYILQLNENDFKFLNKRCIIEGCAFLIFNKELIMYKKSTMEEKNAKEKIDLAASAIEMHKKEIFGTCEFTKGKYTGFAKEINGSKKAIQPWFEFMVTSNSEADRYAKNILRYKNQGAMTGNFRLDEILFGYAPASVISINTEATPSWNEKVILTKIRNEYVTEKSKIFFRKVES